jgi:hypothetical protein
MVTSSRWVVVLVLGLLSQGCSFLFVDGPPDRHEKLAYFDCTSTAGPEVVDITYAVLFGMVAAASSSSSSTESEAVAATLVAAGTFGGSAIYGIVQTSECNKAKDALRIRLQAVFEREARLRALEAREKSHEPPASLLVHPPRLPKRKKHRPVEPVPVVLEEELPPAPPPPPSGALPPAPPPPASAVPAPPRPNSSALPPAPPAPPTARPSAGSTTPPAPPTAPPAPDR